MSFNQESDNELLKHSLALEEKIKQQILSSGPISFAQFMQMALYYPGLGYYSSGLKKLGKDGDFVTSPELGDLFARCFADQFQQILEGMDQAVIMELGAGTGKFSFDVLTALNEKNALPQQYWILEVSADLKQRQKETLSGLPEEVKNLVKWLEEPPTESFNGVIFANEVLDALPVEVFKKTTGNYKQMCVKGTESLHTDWRDFDDHLLSQLKDKQLELTDGYISEFIPNLQHWLHSICESLNQGVVLFVDYGYGRSDYYHPQRSEGTLVCHHKHQANFEYLKNIGVQDITAFVDFTAVAEAADQIDLDVEGFTTQAHFLMSMNIQEKIGSPMDEYSDYYEKATELKKLVMPDEMGEKFKVIALSRNFDQELMGFIMNDSLHLL